uniref:Uncharacterized protein n=1 Tax=Medicago truncatula TaxID=3880 RepID=I3SBM0_MEDTR|nr:unknown [Medicago truncatula]
MRTGKRTRLSRRFNRRSMEAPPRRRHRIIRTRHRFNR